jgi:hypothetical protein
MGIGEHVSMPGFVGKPYAFMANSSVLVSSVNSRGVALVVIEALACGTPVTATNSPATGELLIFRYQLELEQVFSLGLLAFLIGSSLLCLLSVGLAARLAGFRGLEIVTLAVAENARGGPGIVLANVADEAGIIKGTFFTTLVLTANLTSQAAGVWLGYVLRKDPPLLSEGYEQRRDGPSARRLGES